MEKKKNNYIFLIIIVIVGIYVFVDLAVQRNQLKKSNSLNFEKIKLRKIYNCKVYKIEPNILDVKELSLRVEIDEKNSKINIPNEEAYDVKFEKDQILWKNKTINTITKENLVSHNQFFTSTNDWKMTTYLNKKDLSKNDIRVVANLQCLLKLE